MNCTLSWHLECCWWITLKLMLGYSCHSSHFNATRCVVYPGWLLQSLHVSREHGKHTDWRLGRQRQALLHPQGPQECVMPPILGRMSWKCCQSSGRGPFCKSPSPTCGGEEQCARLHGPKHNWRVFPYINAKGAELQHLFIHLVSQQQLMMVNLS